MFLTGYVIYKIQVSAGIYLQATFIECPGSIGDPLPTFQCGLDAGVVLPPLELSEWTQIWILIVETHLKPKPKCKQVNSKTEEKKVSKKITVPKQQNFNS